MSVCSLGDWLNLLALTALAANLTQGDYRVQSLAVGGVFVAKMLPAVLLGHWPTSSPTGSTGG